MRRLLSLCLGCMVLGACAQLPVGAGYNQDDGGFGIELDQSLEALQPGFATYGDVTDALGPPAVMTRLGDGFAFLYDGAALRNRSVSISVYSLRAGYSWSDAGFTLATFVFDGEGRLIGKASERRTDQTGRGFAIGTQRSSAADQFIYLVPASQTFWGRQMLRKIPRTLSQQTNPDSGESGLERRGTTAKVGQRTLESGYRTALALLDLLKTQTGN